MKIGILARRAVPMGNTEKHTVVRFGLKRGLISALVAKYLAIHVVYGSKSCRVKPGGFVAI